MFETCHAGSNRGLAFGGDIDCARRIITHQHNRQARYTAGGLRKSGNRLSYARAQSCRKRLAINDRRTAQSAPLMYRSL